MAYALWAFHFSGLNYLSRKKFISDLPIIEGADGICENCLIGKTQRKPFPVGKSWRTEKQLEIIHSDLCSLEVPSHVDQLRKKLDDKGEKCLFIGYSDLSKAYKFYNPETEKFIISRDVTFDEHGVWDWSGKEEKSVFIPNVPIITNDQPNPENSDPISLENASKENHWLKAMDEEIDSI
ncbi:hypothetical protein LIER_20632 [Lithospermum erythrorhizon]|uniref:Retroviral polymerase SH3-like domain-containing protein n=1 Tax=Lithospermum erythrorhizon TaxID=34254 RepID=A0AAV3QM88_LITER